MSRKKYPNYKPSGIPWLGDVPEGWEVKRLKYQVSINDETLPETTDPDHEMLYVDISSVDPTKGIVNKETHIFENAPSRARRVVRDGDTIVSTVRTYLRAISPVKEPEENLIVSTGFAVIRPRTIDKNYLSSTIRTPYFIEEVVSRSVGVSYPAINASELGLINIPLPPLPEQQAIAAFLDRETGRIDALIEKKKQLIDLLKEKRSAMISRAVTKGLDPSAKMKPSGVPWLGDVPEGWEVKKFSYVIGFQEGPGIMAVDFQDEGIPLLRIRNIQGPYVNLGDCNFLDPNKVADKWNHFKCKKTDLLISGSASTGLVCEVNEIGVGAIPYTGIIRLWPNSGTIAKDFIRWFVSSALFDTQVSIFQAGSTIKHFGPDHLRKMKVPLPPLPEQQSIAAFLDRETSKIDALVSKVETAIERLKEYRTSLISSAVTGKIDVREEMKAEVAHG